MKRKALPLHHILNFPLKVSLIISLTKQISKHHISIDNILKYIRNKYYESQGSEDNR